MSEPDGCDTYDDEEGRRWLSKDARDGGMGFARRSCAECQAWKLRETFPTVCAITDAMKKASRLLGMDEDRQKGLEAETESCTRPRMQV